LITSRRAEGRIIRDSARSMIERLAGRQKAARRNAAPDAGRVANVEPA